MSRRRSAAVAVAAVLALAGCGDDSDVAAPTTRPTTGAPSASATASPTATPTTPAPADARAVAVYYVRDVPPAGLRLYREFHQRPETAEPVRDAVEAMLGTAPRDPDYLSMWPSGVQVRAASVEGDLATVDLSGEAAMTGAGAAGEQAALQQLVHTVTAAAPEVRRVQVLIDGAQRETLWGHVDLRRPLQRAPQEEVLGPVWVIEPGEGGTVARGSTVTGTATVFEATVSWQWARDGAVVAEGFSTASEGAPGRGDWTAPVDVPPGDYELRAFSSSAEDGRPMFVETKRVTVTG